MAKISLKKDYIDGNVLYGKDLNPNFETIETTINANDDAQAGTNANVNKAITQLSSDMSQAKTDISELQTNTAGLATVISEGDASTLESAKSYTDTQLQGYAKTEEVPTKTSDLTNDSGFVTGAAIPTKISQLENDDNTVKDASYVHTDNNYSTEEKNKLASLSNYELPIASASILGGIKLGEGLESEADGTVNVTGGGSSSSIPTLIGTQEDPIKLYDNSSVPSGLAYISGYTKELSSSIVNNNYNGLLLYTSNNCQFIGPYYEDTEQGEKNLNLVVWFRPLMYEVSTGYFSQEFVKFTYNDIITNSEKGYVSPKAVYDYVGALTSLNTTDKSSIVNAINEIANSAGVAGEDGATFTPDVSDDGTLSWTNDKGLTNPDPVNIKGPKGDTGEDYLGYYSSINYTQVPSIGSTVTFQLEHFSRTPVVGDNFVVVAKQANRSYLINYKVNSVDVSDGECVAAVSAFVETTGIQGFQGPAGPAGQDGADGANGQGVPTGGTEGQVLTKNSATDFDTIWKTMESGGSGITTLVGTDEEPINFITGMKTEGIYLLSGKYYRINSATMSEYTSPVLCFISKAMIDIGSDTSITRFIFNFNGGPSLLMGVAQKDSNNNLSWLEYELNPSLSFNGSGSGTSAVSTYMFYKYTGLNNSTNIEDLQTTDKSSLVAAINELKARIDDLETSI